MSQTTEPTPTRWVIPPGQIRTGLLGGNRYSAQMHLGTDGPLTEIADRIDAIGTADAKQRLRERMAGHERISRYARLRAEATALEREERTLALILTRVRAEHAEALAVAAPGFAKTVVALEKQATDMNGRLAAVQQQLAAITSTVETARQDAIRVMQTAAGDVRAGIYAELRVLRDLTIEQIARILSPLLTELAVQAAALVTAASGSLVGDVAGVLEELAAAAADTPEAVR